ncbi:MAG: hypothetical protein ABSF80_04275 [Chitinispirillaceae bacterium]|jgi:hypothetical protein
MQNTKKLYAIIKIAKVRCCGIGNTPEEAFEKSRKWNPSKEGAAISNTPFFPLTRRGTGLGGLCIARCTPDFVKAVETKGGAVWVRFQTDSEGVLDAKEAKPDVDRQFEK